MKTFITIWPFVYVNCLENNTLLYNTLSGESACFESKPSISRIVQKLKNNNYSMVIDSHELDSECKADFLRILVSKGMGYHLNVNEAFVPPVTPQSIDLYDEKMVSNFHNNEFAIESLRELTFYVTNFTKKPQYANPFTLKEGHKQFLFPIAHPKPDELDLDKIRSVFQIIEPHTIRVNILGGNIFHYREIHSLVALLNESKHIVSYYFHYTDLIDPEDFQILSNLPEKADKTVFLDFPLQETHLENWKTYFTQEDFYFEFVVESQAHIEEAERMVRRHEIVNYNLRPFYNNNLDFFKENVFIEKEDILCVKESLAVLLTKKISNPAFFGKLIVDPQGNIYANIHQAPLGNLTTEALHFFIFNLLENPDSVWRVNRNGLKPCSSCIFHLLCPPLSNYEAVIGKINLCNVKP